MCVIPAISASFKPSKIELEKIKITDLPNYSNLQKLARERFCDFLIKKYDSIKSADNYNVFRVFARRRWINPQYVFGEDTITLQKNAPAEVVSQKIYEASIHAADMAKTKTKELAQKFIGK